MSFESAIEWTDATFSPWWGCEKVSAACRSCYAEAWATRWGLDVWGKDSARRFFGDKHWSEPVKWNRKAQQAGVRRRVFCASMADVFEDRRDLDRDRMRLWELISATPWLDWLLLTKRPENIERFAPSDWVSFGKPAPNVWLGTTAENQKEADKRIPFLLKHGWAAQLFVSAEPLLERLELAPYLNGDAMGPRNSITWVICGGESGGHARPFDLTWARDLRDQCAKTGTAYFFKQAGARPVDGLVTLRLINRKGGNLAEIPSNLHVRQFPTPHRALRHIL